MMIPSIRRRGKPKKTWSECVKADMKMCSLGSIDPLNWSECAKADMKMCSPSSIDPLNREAWGLGVRHSSHLLPTPVPETPAAEEK